MKYTVEGRRIEMHGCSFLKRHQHFDISKVINTKYGTFLDKSTGLSESINISPDTPLFDLSNPVGYYSLDMTVPYNQTIAAEMYYLASYSSGYYFKMMKHNGSAIEFVPRKVGRTDDLLRKRRRLDVSDSGRSSPASPGK